MSSFRCLWITATITEVLTNWIFLKLLNSLWSFKIAQKKASMFFKQWKGNIQYFSFPFIFCFIFHTALLRKSLFKIAFNTVSNYGRSRKQREKECKRPEVLTSKSNAIFTSFLQARRMSESECPQSGGASVSWKLQKNLNWIAFLRPSVNQLGFFSSWHLSFWSTKKIVEKTFIFESQLTETH